MPRTRRAAAAPPSRTRRTAAVLAALSLSALSAAGCAASPDLSVPPAAESSAAAVPVVDSGPPVSAFASTAGTRVSLASAGSLGPILVDAQGRTLYLYGADTTVHASCLDECAKSWPPVTTPGFPLAGPGVDDGLLGAAALPDGTAQVLYKGHPLYRYTGDHGPGETAGHTVAGPGGTFYAVTSLGDPVGVDIATLRGAGGAVPSASASAGASASASASASAGTQPDAAASASAAPADPGAQAQAQAPAQTPAAQAPAVQPPAQAPAQPPADGAGTGAGAAAGTDGSGGGGAPAGDDGSQEG
ncbi:COG4315 family predicted lipoprotein [Kitasatospora cineracea]|uniref:COG4315 family predicted lipoprotein n=1 Tax=Kitasatospora cineracea TaxID=88074 RepID=UPI0036BA71C2